MKEIKQNMNYASLLMTEWKQCMDEGYDVESYKPLCARIAARGGKNDEIAEIVANAMMNEPMREGYPFVEPSDYEGILAARPAKRHTFAPLSRDVMADKIRGAWIGRVSGCLLGKPVEGMETCNLHPLLKDTDNYPMHKYIMYGDFTEEILKNAHPNHPWADCIHGIAPIDDDTNYTVFGLKLIEWFGRDFTSDNVMFAWHSLIPYADVWTAEDIAYRNGTIGLRAPESALYRNPYREWIGAQIRGDFFGYINPGDTEAAASMAFRDAAISHIKNGIYGEMFASAMIAAAACTDDIMTVIEAGLDEIPEKCRLRAEIERVIGWYRDGLDREAMIAKILEMYNEHDRHVSVHTISNAMICVMALLTGEGDLGKSICAAVQGGMDTDCNGATVGSIVGMMNGGSAIDPYWVNAWGGRLLTSIKGYENVSVDDMTEKTLAQIKA